MSTARRVYTVAQVNQYLHQIFQTDSFLNRIYVKGEVSNCKYHGSGHIYFSLKDETAQMACVMFSSNRKGLNFLLRDGQKIIVFGNMGIYERGGSYQLYASAIRLDGIGVLYERYEALKQELGEMGMFDPMYKKPIPRYISRLGVVTAPTGAAIRDIINVSKRRHPGIEILVYPALVQGQGAAGSIVRGIQVLDGAGVDVILVGRGGGSIEDLWAFNERTVAEAIFNAHTPIISAVGHETDTTIADYVADLRAPTPSAGAELAVDDMVAACGSLTDLRWRLEIQMAHKGQESRKTLEGFRFRLQALGPLAQVRERALQADHLQDRMQAAMDRSLVQAKDRLTVYQGRIRLDGRLTEARHRLSLLGPRLASDMARKIEGDRGRIQVLEARIRSGSPRDRLDKGFAYMTDEEGRPIRSVRQLAPGVLIQAVLRDGRLKAQVTETERREEGS